MTDNETPQQSTDRLIQEARLLASSLPFDERAKLIRGVVNSVRDAVKLDATLGGAPQGREWELEGLNVIHQDSEDYFAATLAEKNSRQS